MEGRLPGARCLWPPTGGWKPPLLRPTAGSANSEMHPVPLGLTSGGRHRSDFSPKPQTMRLPAAAASFVRRRSRFQPSLDNSLERSVAAMTVSLMRPRKSRAAMRCSPAKVVPLGEVT